jgi:triosephosphate isomerase (TIM)
MNAPLVVGNWKMNGLQGEAVNLAHQISRQLKQHSEGAEVAIAPPFTALPVLAKALRLGKLKLVGQNCHWEASGAFTGEISAPMLSELTCEYVMLGHSERRHVFHETDEMIARKLSIVIAHRMRVILCVGETLAERRRKKTVSVVTAQLDAALKGAGKGVIDNLEIAYEPVWAIGTGQNASPEQVSEVHDNIRSYLRSGYGKLKGSAVRILYGGSVKPENASTLAKIKEVNGLLVGGASLKAETFLPIVEAFNKQ